MLHRRARTEEIRDSIYSRDKLINELLRSIRRKIVRHLTINPESDVAASLALMSVAKDAERIGDYCKNVFEVGQYYKEDFRLPAYQEPLDKICEQVQRLFGQVSRAFQHSDEDEAKAALKSADAIGDDCDRIIEQLLGDPTTIETHEAVAYSLLARHYKRVSSHLSNVTTAVMGQVDELDFRP